MPSRWNKRHQGYLFDLDGTLLDTAPDLHRAQNATLAAFGYQPVPIERTRRWVGHGARALLARSLDDQQADHHQLDAMFDWFLEFYEANIASASEPFPWVLSTLETLRDQGAKLAVVTNKRLHLTEVLLADLDLGRYFDAVVGGDSAGKPKPDAAPAALACDYLNLTARDVLFVGDSSTDVGCARAFGCPVVCVPYGYREDALEDLGADAIIDDFRALLT